MCYKLGVGLQALGGLHRGGVAKMRVEGKKSQSGKVLGGKGDVGGPETVGRGVT